MMIESNQTYMIAKTKHPT